MIVAWVRVGRGVSGAIVNGPVPGMSKRIVSGGALVARLAPRMAWRSEPGAAVVGVGDGVDLRVHVDRHRRHVGDRRALDVLVGEGVGPDEVRVRRVGERAVGVERQLAVRRAR